MTSIICTLDYFETTDILFTARVYLYKDTYITMYLFERQREDKGGKEKIMVRKERGRNRGEGGCSGENETRSAEGTIKNIKHWVRPKPKARELGVLCGCLT